MQNSHSSSKHPPRNIQYEQKILHYRSEIKRLEQKTTKQAKQLKEQVEAIDSLTARINDQAPKPVQIATETVESLLCFSYFSYTLIVPDRSNRDESITIIGDLIIENEGTNPLTNPMICLEFNKPTLATLTGKIQRSPSTETEQYIIEEDRVTNTWKFVEGSSYKEARQTGVYWLKPIHTSIIEPSQSLFFPSFEIQLKPDDNASTFEVSAYVLSDELSNGQKASNKIRCNLI
ncbi:hypothetical protein [Bacillus sp. FJAT-45037]|uniref:hypothetical protein n=1 Tax=Bacillus sp. FJAT-45037 TaxID=2011007 RepID=UPI000C242571|nr:hypothetical protein [Bacillus sp. FJAT-45037]